MFRKSLNVPKGIADERVLDTVPEYKNGRLDRRNRTVLRERSRRYERVVIRRDIAHPASKVWKWCERKAGGRKTLERCSRAAHRVHRTEKSWAAPGSWSGDTRRYAKNSIAPIRFDSIAQSQLLAEARRGAGKCQTFFFFLLPFGFCVSARVERRGEATVERVRAWRIDEKQFRRYYDKIFTDRNRKGKAFSGGGVVLAAVSGM